MSNYNLNEGEFPGRGLVRVSGLRVHLDELLHVRLNIEINLNSPDKGDDRLMNE